MTAIFYIQSHLLHMIIETVAVIFISHCMMNKTIEHADVVGNLVENMSGQILWKPSSNCRYSTDNTLSTLPLVLLLTLYIKGQNTTFITKGYSSTVHKCFG